MQTRVYALRREDVVDRHPARLVVEAVLEDEQLKTSVFAELDRHQIHHEVLQ